MMTPGGRVGRMPKVLPCPGLPCCRWGNDSGPRRDWGGGVCFWPRGGLEGPKERMLLVLNLRVEEG